MLIMSFNNVVVTCNVSRMHRRSPLSYPFQLMSAIIVINVMHLTMSSTVTTSTSLITGTLPSSPVMNSYPKLTSYKTYVARARCQARCNAKFGMKKVTMPQEFHEFYRPYVCSHSHVICLQCSSQCSKAIISARDCAGLCTTDICLGSCLFFNTTVYQEAETPDYVMAPTSDLPAHSKKIILTVPVPSCLYTPSPLDIDSRGSTVVLRWNILGSNGQATSYPLSFVIEVKELMENKTQTEWQTLGYTNFSVIPIIKLNSSSEFIFRVSAVAQEGLVALPVSSEWIRFPPALPPQPPQNVSVVKQYIRGYALRAEVQWTVPNNSGCYFKLYWMTPKNGSFHSRELKEWMGFKCELNNLHFDSDYKLEIQTYDRFFRISSEKVTVEFSTPSCLKSTNYDYHSCAPDPPIDVSANISERYEANNTMYTNVTLTWKPPKHVSWHNTIERYTIIWRKTPDIRYTLLIPPDRRALSVNGDITDYTATYVHWDSEYIATVAAVSKGGEGDKATIKIVTGKGYSQLVSEESHVTETSKSNSKVYYATIIPTLIMAIVIALCTLYCFRLRKNIQHLEHEGPTGKEEINPLYEMTVAPADREREPLLPNDKYEVDYGCLKFTDLLGEGAFGKVHKAVFTQIDNAGQRGAQTSTTRTVAVKMLKEHATPEEKRFLLMEINALKSLGYHRHLVSIVACVTDVDRPCLIMDYCPLGDLRNYLRQHRKQVHYMPRLSISTSSISCTNSTNAADTTTSNYTTTNSTNRNTDSFNVELSETLSQTTLLSYARQITIGMEYLNQNRFIHRDLASRNILMSSHELVKISDFGLSRDVYETNVYQPTSGRRLPYKWMPIESIFDQIFTIKSDVWSYGILLWEIITLGGCPYPGIPNKDLFRLLKEGYRLARPSSCSSDLYNIMLSCWHPSPEDRPSFTQLRKKMESLLEDTCSYIDLNSEVSRDCYSKSGTGQESADTQSQKNIPTPEQTMMVDLHVANTNDALTVCRDSAVNTSICQRYYRYDAAAPHNNRNVKNDDIHNPASSDPYSFHSNEPVPGLSEELLQQTHSSAKHGHRVMQTDVAMCESNMSNGSTTNHVSDSTNGENGPTDVNQKMSNSTNEVFSQDIPNNNASNQESRSNSVDVVHEVPNTYATMKASPL